MSKARIIADYAGTGASTDLATQDELNTVSTVANAALPKAGGDMSGLLKANAGVIFNEDAADVDFRVEGVGSAHALFVQGSDGKVGIGCTPAYNLDISPSSGDAELKISGAEGQSASIRLFADEGDDSGDIKRLLTDTSGNFKIQHYASGAYVDSLTIDSSGNVEVNNGNLVIGTSGKGIDFSATSDGGVSTPSELLDDYEEGTWTPVLEGSTNAGSYSYDTYRTGGTYTRIGNTVFARGSLRPQDPSPSSDTKGVGNFVINGWPYAPINQTGTTSWPYSHAVVMKQGGFTTSSTTFATRGDSNGLNVYEQSTTTIVSIDVTDADEYATIWSFTWAYLV